MVTHFPGLQRITPSLDAAILIVGSQGRSEFGPVNEVENRLRFSGVFTTPGLRRFVIICKGDIAGMLFLNLGPREVFQLHF